MAQLDIPINTINTTYNSPYLLETNVGPNGADPCHGDSGGPLLLREADNKWTLIATLLGGGFNCAVRSSTDKTSDWNRVLALLPWIRATMEGNILNILDI